MPVNNYQQLGVGPLDVLRGVVDHAVKDTSLTVCLSFVCSSVMWS